MASSASLIGEMCRSRIGVHEINGIWAQVETIVHVAGDESRKRMFLCACLFVISV